MLSSRRWVRKPGFGLVFTICCQVARKAKRADIFKRAEKFAKEYQDVERDEIRWAGQLPEGRLGWAHVAPQLRPRNAGQADFRSRTSTRKTYARRNLIYLLNFNGLF